MAIFRRKITADDKKVTSAANLTLKQSLFPNCLVTILFFLWGFGYGLLDTLNSHFQAELDLRPSQSAGLQASYFGAYFICPLTVSGWLLRRFGFRVTFMSGLAFLAVGCLMFWPSAVRRSFGGFCGSMFIVGSGLSTLETAADPFLSICGPPRYSEIRLNLAQAVQGVGTFIAPLLASRVFFAETVDNSQGLENVQWTYLGVAGFVGLLLILFFLAPFPEITDADMSTQEAAISDADVGPLKKQYNLFFAVWSQFHYVGAQVAIAGYFINFAQEAGKSPSVASDMLAVAQGLFAAMRLIGGIVMIAPAAKPRYLLALYLGLCFVFSIAAATTEGNTSIAMAILVLAFESICFPTIFAMGLRGLGRHTKRGGSFIVAAISGGMVYPAIMGAVIDVRNAHVAMVIPMSGYFLSWLYPMYVNCFNRSLMDEHRQATVGIDPPSTEKELGLSKDESPMHVEHVSEKNVTQSMAEMHEQ